MGRDRLISGITIGAFLFSIFMVLAVLFMLVKCAAAATVVKDTRTGKIVEMHGHDLPEADARANAISAGVPADKVQVIYGEEALNIIKETRPKLK